MSIDAMRAQMTDKPGFIAALDQSGGSTPGALRGYGIPDDGYSGDEEMFRLIHDMRVRIITAPSFSGDKVIAAILFERTMDGMVDGRKVPDYLWTQRGIVPFLKIDKGLEAEADGVRLMKPNPTLDTLLERASGLGIFGTKERSVIAHASPSGIAAIVAQQMEIGAQVARHGLVPILEPEVLINSPDKAEAEALLLAELTKQIDADGGDWPLMLKLTIPDVPDAYASLIAHRRVARVVALSGGYPLEDACRRLAHNHGMIASFSRALLDDLKRTMSDEEFDRALGHAIDKIYQASTVKG